MSISYSNKASAVRGAKRAGIINPQFDCLDNRWYVLSNDASLSNAGEGLAPDEIEQAKAFDAAIVDTLPQAMAAQSAAIALHDAPVEGDLPACAVEPALVIDKGGRRRRSEGEGAVARVFAIVAAALAASGGDKVKRKDLMAACEREGIAFYTARTQIQKALVALVAKSFDASK